MRITGALPAVLLLLLLLALSCAAADLDDRLRNATSAAPPREGSIADFIDRALEKEFAESEQTGGGE